MLELENFETLCSLSEGLVDVCKPLALINLDYFHYVKVYDDGSRISLTNKSEWMRYYYKHELYRKPTVSKKKSTQKNDYYFWGIDSECPVLGQLSTFFNIHSGAVIVEENQKSSSFYYFGSNAKTLLKGFSSEKLLALMRHFVFYFKDKCYDTISLAEQHKIRTPEEISSYIKPEVSPQQVDYYLLKTPIRHYYVENSSETIFFSQREVDCIGHFLLGRSAKETARFLNISPRTVEKHIERIRVKLHCFNRFEMMEKLLDTQFAFFKQDMSNLLFTEYDSVWGKKKES